MINLATPPTAAKTRSLAKASSAKVVYHYTDAGGLLGILNSNTLRATSFQSLNDSSELSYGVNLICDVFKTSELIGDPAAIDVLSKFVDDLQQHLLDRDYFIVCASRDGDSLNQWRNYAAGNGYALGLETGIYAQVVDPTHDFPQKKHRDRMTFPVWMDVIYLETDQRAAASQIFQDLVVQGDSLIDDAMRAGKDPDDDLLMRLGNFAATLKHPAFAVEQEVRLIVDRDRFARPEFHPGRFGILPYIEVGQGSASPGSNGQGFALTNERRNLRPLSISSIACGPGEDFGRDRRRRVAEALATRHGYDIPVTASQIPLVT
jgi:hypothetical protein